MSAATDIALNNIIAKLSEAHKELEALFEEKPDGDLFIAKEHVKEAILRLES